MSDPGEGDSVSSQATLRPGRDAARSGDVTKTTWPDLSLEKQRERLLAGLAPLVARKGAEVTGVFDAAEKQERPLVNRPRGVRAPGPADPGGRAAAAGALARLLGRC